MCSEVCVRVCVFRVGIKALAPQKHQLIVHFSDNKHRRQEFIISGLAALRIRHVRAESRAQTSDKSLTSHTHTHTHALLGPN